MKISQNTIVKLVEVINEKPIYRSGSQLVSFFNNISSRDVYGQGFPSRASYTESKLIEINGTSDMDKCIKQLLAPLNYIENPTMLTQLMENLNKYLTYDGWIAYIKGRDVHFKRSTDKDWESIFVDQPTTPEDQFLSEIYESIDFYKLDLEVGLKEILKSRIEDVEKTLPQMHICH